MSKKTKKEYSLILCMITINLSYPCSLGISSRSSVDVTISRGVVGLVAGDGWVVLTNSIVLVVGAIILG